MQRSATPTAMQCVIVPTVHMCVCVTALSVSLCALFAPCAFCGLSLSHFQVLIDQFSINIEQGGRREGEGGQDEWPGQAACEFLGGRREGTAQQAGQLFCRRSLA